METTYLYGEGNRLVAEYSGTGTLLAQYVYSTGRHVPDFMLKDGTVYQIVTDQVGSVRMVVDVSTGDVEQQIDYVDAWGKVAAHSFMGLQPFAFAGGLYDPDTKLVHFGARQVVPICNPHYTDSADFPLLTTLRSWSYPHLQLHWPRYLSRESWSLLCGCHPVLAVGQFAGRSHSPLEPNPGTRSFLEHRFPWAKPGSPTPTKPNNHPGSLCEAMGWGGPRNGMGIGALGSTAGTVRITMKRRWVILMLCTLAGICVGVAGDALSGDI